MFEIRQQNLLPPGSVKISGRNQTADFICPPLEKASEPPRLCASCYDMIVVVNVYIITYNIVL